MGAHGQERDLQGTPSKYNLSDLAGRDLTSSSPVKARITGPSGDSREEGRGGGGCCQWHGVGTLMLKREL